MTNEQREAIEELKSLSPSEGAIDIVLSLIKEQQEEIERKNKIIEESIKYIDSNNYVDSEECQFQQDFNIKCIGNIDCKDCIKQYFAGLVEKE